MRGQVGELAWGPGGRSESASPSRLSPGHPASRARGAKYLRSSPDLPAGHLREVLVGVLFLFTLGVLLLLSTEG